jgi:hypothetical protein
MPERMIRRTHRVVRYIVAGPGRGCRGIRALTRPSLALSLGGSRRKTLWLSISARAENRCDDGGCIRKSLSRISLFSFLRDRPESLGDRTPYRQQTLGSSCVPWFVASSCPTDVGRCSMSPSGANDKGPDRSPLTKCREIYAPDFSNGTIAAKS